MIQRIGSNTPNIFSSVSGDAHSRIRAGGSGSSESHLRNMGKNDTLNPVENTRDEIEYEISDADNDFDFDDF